MKTVKEIAKMFGVSNMAVYKWLKDGLPHTREKVIGRKTCIVINPGDVINYHKAKEQE